MYEHEYKYKNEYEDEYDDDVDDDEDDGYVGMLMTIGVDGGDDGDGEYKIHADTQAKQAPDPQ